MAITVLDDWTFVDDDDPHSTDDTPRYFAIWDESQIAAASGGKFWWGASTITNEFFGYAVYGNVKQTGLDSLVNNYNELYLA